VPRMSLCRVTCPYQPTFAAAADFLFRVARAFGFGAAAGAARAVISWRISVSACNQFFSASPPWAAQMWYARSRTRSVGLIHRTTSFVLDAHQMANKWLMNGWCAAYCGLPLPGEIDSDHGRNYNRVLNCVRAIWKGI
jgi:hypothetical protein